jgi:hypothetical protein
VLQGLRAWNTNVPLTVILESLQTLPAEIDFGELRGAQEETTLFVLPRSIQRVASSDRLSSGTTMMVTYFMSNVRWIEPL